MNIFKGYKFTNKKHPAKGIMSAILGVIALLSVSLAIYMPYRNREQVSESFALACLLSMLLSVIGIILAVICRVRHDNYKLFPNTGLILNGIVLAICGYIIYLGA